MATASGEIASRHLAGALVSSGNVTTVPLFSGFGSHYAWMRVGTPPQRVSLTISTHSSVLALPCTKDESFNANRSSTYSQVDCNVASSFFQCKSCKSAVSGCEISQTYVSGSSYSAKIAQDFLYLEGEEHDAVGSSNQVLKNRFGTNFMFGCRFKETGLFTVGGVDGLLGLSNSDNALVAKLYDEKKIPDKLFSLCLTPDGGFMSVGAIDKSRHSGEIAYIKLASDPLNTYVPRTQVAPRTWCLKSHNLLTFFTTLCLLIINRNFFNIKLKDLQVGNASIEAPPATYSRGHFTVDSGTTYTYLPVSMKNYFAQAFQQATGLDYEVSGDLLQAYNGYSGDQVALFPAIRFVLEAENTGGGEDDLVLELTPSQYLIYENDRFCGGLFFTQDYGGFIGANVMMHRDVIFDGDNDRIGFADANCTYKPSASSLLTSAGTNTSSSSDSRAGSSSAVDGSSGDTADAGNADTRFASTASRNSYTVSCVIGVACMALVLAAAAFALRQKRRAGAKRGGAQGDVFQLKEFDDDFDDGDNDGNESQDDADQKESFVTPHFLIHSPPALISRSPRNQILEEEEKTDGGDHHNELTTRKLAGRKARETRRSSKLQGVEL